MAGLPLPSSIQQPLGRSVPRSNTYQAREVNIGRIQSQFSGGPQIREGVGEGLQSLAGALDKWTAVFERQEQQKQTLEAMEEVSVFKDKERLMLEQMNNMKGKDGFDAPAFAQSFYEKEGPALTGKARGDFQKMYYETFLNKERGQGLDAAQAHRTAELGRWEDSVMLGEMTNLYTELDANPASWADIEAEGIAKIQLANPGLDTTAKEHAFRQQLAKLGVESAAAQGDTDTARKIMSGLGQALSAKEKSELETSFARASSEGRVMAYVDQAGPLVLDGQGPEVIADIESRYLNGEISYDEMMKMRSQVESLDSKVSSQRQRQLTAENDDAESEMFELEKAGNLTPETVAEKTAGLSVEKQRFWEKVARGEAGIQAEIRKEEKKRQSDSLWLSIQNGDIASPLALDAWYTRHDPDFVLYGAEDRTKFAGWLQTATGDGDQFNYVDSFMRAYGDKLDDPVAKENFRQVAFSTLRALGINKNDSQAYKTLEDLWQKDPNRKWHQSSQPIWQTDNPLDYLQAPSQTRPETLKEIARGKLSRGGWEETDTTLARALAATELGVPVDRVPIPGSERWTGRGALTLPVGRVRDYKSIIERQGATHGVDPNLIASVIWEASQGNSKAAGGLMGLENAPVDPAGNIAAGARRLKELQDRYRGNIRLAVAAFFAGQDNIDRGNHPREARDKVVRVFKMYDNQVPAPATGTIQDTRGLPKPAGLVGATAAPLANMLVTSKYGQRNTGIVGASRDHQGLDLRAPIGTPVGAFADGVVETATYKGRNGNYVVVDHGGGRKSYYLHLSEFSQGLQPGLKVRAGQTIALSGNSGDFKKALDPHLDFRLSENGTFVDPAKYLPGLQYKKGA